MSNRLLFILSLIWICRSNTQTDLSRLFLNMVVQKTTLKNVQNSLYLFFIVVFYLINLQFNIHFKVNISRLIIYVPNRRVPQCEQRQYRQPLRLALRRRMLVSRRLFTDWWRVNRPLVSKHLRTMSSLFDHRFMVLIMQLIDASMSKTPFLVCNTIFRVFSFSF